MGIISENGREFKEVSLPLDTCDKLEAIATLLGMNPWREDKVIDWLIENFQNKPYDNEKNMREFRNKQ